MSHLAPPSSQALSDRLRPRGVAWLTALLLLVAVAAGTVKIAADSGGSSAPSAPSVSRPAGGPNETLRGISAATSAGTVYTHRAGGPNETLRGQVLAHRGIHPMH